MIELLILACLGLLWGYLFGRWVLKPRRKAARRRTTRKAPAGKRRRVAR